MPDSRTHRGPHPEDLKLFAPSQVAVLAQAVEDVSWLLTKGYSRNSVLKLVGDRYALIQRQRVAVGRSACPDESRDLRLHKQATPAAGSILYIDGYNVVTTIEAALGHGIVLKCRDSTFRDLAAMQGTYRKVEETPAALAILAELTSSLELSQCVFYLDQPVSNSGRLKKAMLEAAQAKAAPWGVELVKDPDQLLSSIDGAVATSDSHILDKCRRWYNLARLAVEQFVPQAWVVDLSPKK